MCDLELCLLCGSDQTVDWNKSGRKGKERKGDACLAGANATLRTPNLHLENPSCMSVTGSCPLFFTGENASLSPAKMNGSESSKSLPSPSCSPQQNWIASPSHDPQWYPNDSTDSSLSSLFCEWHYMAHIGVGFGSTMELLRLCSELPMMVTLSVTKACVGTVSCKVQDPDN